MIKLSRDVRFALTDAAPTGVANGHAGFPPVMGLDPFITFTVTLAGELDPISQYLLNIKNVDQVVRERIVPFLLGLSRNGKFTHASICDCFDLLRDAFGSRAIDSVQLAASPFSSIGLTASELPMIRLNHKFEFSAAHRLFNSTLEEAQNREIFGKCSNPHGHGHNYELQVTIRGTPDADGLLMATPQFERIVMQHAIEVLDHKNLNVEVPAFASVIPTCENIARVIFGLLKPHFASTSAQLASVIVWETPKTWCEYSED